MSKLSKLRNKFITVFAVLFCALLIAGTALMIPKNKSAEAYSGPQTATIGELYDANSSSKFNTDNLRSLYNALSSGADRLLEVDKKLKITESGRPVANQSILVQFGGKVWIAAYLSKATTTHSTEGGASLSVTAGTKGIAEKGDIILTLWLAYSNKLNIWNKSFSYDIGTYPCNMYGTSYMRAAVLNNGGQYWKDVNNLDSPHVQESNNDFARFTMTGAENSVVDYLVAPRFVQWQYQQHSQGVGNPSCTNDLNNDAWGSVGSTGFYNTTFYYENFSHYSAWKDDLVWLPSLAEVGFGNTGNQGLWQTTLQQRENPSGAVTNWMWVRSAGQDACFRAFSMGGSGYGTQFGNGDTVGSDVNRLIRPAIHLNLTKASGVGFDDDLKTIPNGDGDNKKIYDGKALEVYMPDFKRLTLVSGPNENGTATDKASYEESTGKFSATVPNTNAVVDKNVCYEITVRPSGTYRWDDNDGTEARTYKFRITPASINATWNDFSALNGDSVLQDLQAHPITSSTDAVGATFKEKYFVAKKSSDYLSLNPDEWNTSSWEDRADGDAYFTVSQAVTHRVYYEITADHHITKRGFYEVTVNADSVKVTIKSGINASMGNATYSEGNAQKLEEAGMPWFKNKAISMLTFTRTNTNTEIKNNDLETLWGRLEIYPFTYDGNNVKVNSSANSYNHYDVNTYLFGVRYKSDTPAADQTYTFTWDIQDGKEVHPTFTVTKKTVKVKVVGKDGAALTHVYGETPVDMTYALANEHFFDANGENINVLKLWDDFTVKDTAGDVIESTTPVGTYSIIGAALESNYDVQFDNSPYVIEKRPVKLQVADEEAEYGTSFDDYKYKLMTVIEGSILDIDDLETLTADAVYSLKQNGIDTSFSNTLLRGDYELYAEVEADNYIFTIVHGKLSIVKANFNMSGVKLENAAYVHDGNPHPAQLSGDPLPSNEISVSYRYVNVDDGSESTDAPKEIGLYLVYASFTHTNENYNEIKDKVAYIRIAATAEEANQPFPPLPTDDDLAAAKALAEKKADAKKKLDEEATAKKDAIEANKDMTAEDKKAAKEEIEKELAEGNAAIDKAQNAGDVDKAFEAGKKEMKDTVDLAEAKTDAKKQLGEEAKAKADAIDADTNLTSEEKKAAKEEIEKELEEGKKEIDKATDASGAQSAESSSKKKIKDFADLVQKKGEAKAELEKVAKEKKEEIKNSEMNAEEQAAANAKVDAELAAGKEAIDSATGGSGVTSSQSEAEEKIKDVSTFSPSAELANKKQAAKDALQKDADKKNAEIEASDMTDEEKAKAKAEVEAELQNGFDNIDKAASESEINGSYTESKAIIDEVKIVRKSSSSFPWWIIAVVAGVLAVAVIVIVVLKRRKATAEGDDYYDDDYYDDEDEEYDYDEEFIDDD